MPWSVGDTAALRQSVIRRVRYALNTHALLDDRVPPEGAYDSAITNALVQIVAAEWPGAERDPAGRLKSAAKLLDFIVTSVDEHFVPSSQLREGIELSQEARHGRSDDEWQILNESHIDALAELDGHESLGVLERLRGRTYNDSLVLLFEEEVGVHLPSRPKDRLDFPDPDECDECYRPTFVVTAWDDFGGNVGPGFCIACGHTRSNEDASDLAVGEAMRRAMDRPD